MGTLLQDVKKSSTITSGALIAEIDGTAIDDSIDWASLLNRKTGKSVKLKGINANGDAFNTAVKPISRSEENNLMYNRWVKGRKDYVEKISNGEIGYVHVKEMNDDSFRKLYDKTMGENREKLALVVDTRFNGGGWLHDDLNTFLSGKEYLKFAPQGKLLKSSEPISRWTKPGIVVMCEANYSDAFIFPYIYRQNGLGKLVGMPVAGTGTAVWWKQQIDSTLQFGIPMIGTFGKDKPVTENLQLQPDIQVPLPYEDFLAGKDPQLLRAVQELLR